MSGTSETNILDESFVKSFSALQNIQLLLGTARVNLKKRLVGSPSTRQRIYSSVLIIAVAICGYDMTTDMCILAVLRKLLLAFEEFVNLYKYQLYTKYDWVCLPISLLFNFSLFIGLNKTYADFLTQVKSTRVLCVYLLSVYQEGAIYNKASRMLRELDERRPQFSVYGMFALHAALPLRVLAVASNYVVVQLQFAFL
ncbi:hypothetical protein EVAR_2399_1 [Eumeta japonica]|uniref:Uncharacterized protein n=1 Tax=Eumeta variegata TaxID=151549 RepID=A0A4C1SN50_EUMVA|nr:hypothetical protein EVAR_2399_1 [Eumeta japonica]